MSEFLKHEPCPKCGSKDNLARYADGSAYCFGCSFVEKADGETSNNLIPKNLYQISDYENLVARKISLETCRKYGYGVIEKQGKRYQVATYRNEQGTPVAQKLRDAHKNFAWVGDAKAVQLYGQHLFTKGKMLTLCEGEIDTLTCSQIFGNKWACVGIPNGAQHAKKAVAANLDFCNSFEAIHICFDMDEPGRKAAVEVAELFEPGKAKIVNLPMKDANEMLVDGKVHELISAIYDAKPYRPDGIVSGTDTWDIITKKEIVDKADYPWPKLNTYLHGIRKGELITITAGSGIGKSLFCKELAFSLLNQDRRVGYIALEESIKRTVLGLISIQLNKPIHLEQTEVPEDELKKAWDTVINNDRLHLYNHFGSTSDNNLLNRVRYIAKSLHVDYVVLDHLSMVVSGIAEGDERRLIDNIMTKLRTLVEETGIGLILVSHLKRLEGNRSHEDGVETSLSHLRGSAAIGQLSDLVIGLERNQQSEGKDSTVVRILKNRYSGQTGKATVLQYQKDSGRLLEINDVSQEFEEVEVTF